LPSFKTPVSFAEGLLRHWWVLWYETVEAIVEEESVQHVGVGGLERLKHEAL